MSEFLYNKIKEIKNRINMLKLKQAPKVKKF